MVLDVLTLYHTSTSDLRNLVGVIIGSWMVFKVTCEVGTRRSSQVVYRVFLFLVTAKCQNGCYYNWPDK